jgi:hypothetical protein
MVEERMQGYFQCNARPGEGDGGVFSKAAFERLQAGGPFTCPICRTSCHPKFTQATPSGEGQVLVHTDDENGGTWERQIGWTVSFRNP